MLFKSIVRLFEKSNVCVTGLVGTGKDMLFANVICRRNKPYISNIDYGGYFAPFDFKKLDVGGNTYKDFIDGTLSRYEFPYSQGSDVYLSDVGVYLPAQYCNELNKDYKHISTYMALHRQLSRNRFHLNVQNLNRAYDKLREMSEIYIRCRSCIYIPVVNIVIQLITLYDKYESCVARIRPCRVSGFSLNPVARAQADTYRDNFFNTHGSVKNKILIYHNRSKYDTYYFKKLLKEAPEREKDNSQTQKKSTRF